ncbi:DNA-processing protein DprA [Salimicrobium halophilum]|uniref:DNA processing protein n=1 Tax=Salimicrobium halophilum TaxID=86666 RepID=A0A1G8QC23_9BACI|nr:DNA-processing protein DprA [Salimicrobium halophilum]SDJ02148.1 DNA processing protein [Salimicrobium halophilum]
MDDIWNLLLLQSSPNVTRRLLKQMIRQDPSLSTFIHSPPERWHHQLSLPVERANKIRNHVSDAFVNRTLSEALRRFHVLTIIDRKYPDALKRIPDPPLVLYASGDLSLLEHNRRISVIGTRKPSSYALPAMKKIFLPMVETHCLVSGMAQGVDQFAHQLAIKNGGRTIAILGSGFNKVYPKNDLTLYQRLMTEELVLSEHAPHIAPEKYHFPERNRLISGLSDATVVVEARMKSGTMITVDQALEQGKEVYAFPGPVGSETSEGCHFIIDQGAKIVHTHHDILVPEQRSKG